MRNYQSPETECLELMAQNIICESGGGGGSLAPERTSSTGSGSGVTVDSWLSAW